MGDRVFALEVTVGVGDDALDVVEEKLPDFRDRGVYGDVLGGKEEPVDVDAEEVAQLREGGLAGPKLPALDVLDGLLGHADGVGQLGLGEVPELAVFLKVAADASVNFLVGHKSKKVFIVPCKSIKGVLLL